MYEYVYSYTVSLFGNPKFAFDITYIETRVQYVIYNSTSKVRMIEQAVYGPGGAALTACDEATA